MGNRFLYPAISSVIYFCLLSWVNNLIQILQAKNLNNSNSINTLRSAQSIRSSTRLKRLEAKRDVMYEMVKTGAEKDIQEMKETIIESKDRMGELTSELDIKKEQLQTFTNKAVELENILSVTKKSNEHLTTNYNKVISELNNHNIGVCPTVSIPAN